MDRDLLINLFLDSRTDLSRFVASILSERHDLVEDVTQDVFVKAVQQADGIRDPHSGRSWLFQTAKRLAIDQVRRQPRLVDLDQVDQRAQHLGRAEPVVPGPVCAPSWYRVFPDLALTSRQVEVFRKLESSSFEVQSLRIRHKITLSI